MTRRIPWIPVVMVSLFVAAVVYVNPLDAGREAPARPAADHGVHSGVTEGGDGLSDSHDGYLLSPVTLPDRRGGKVPLAFRIIGPGGAATTAFDPSESQPIHLYLLREDLSFYQHLHPALSGDMWSAAVDVPDGGVYRLYTEFVPKERAGSGHPVVLGAPFAISGDTRYLPLPAPAPKASTGGFTVSRLDGGAAASAGRSGTLSFQVRDARGAPVSTLEPYLGVYAHASVFDASTQRLTHLHPTLPASTRAAPADGVLTFHTQFPQRDRHRVFVQFKVGGDVHLAAFTVIAS